MNVIGAQSKPSTWQKWEFFHEFVAGTEIVQLRTMDGPQMPVDPRLVNLLRRANIMQYHEILSHAGFDDYEQLLHMSISELRTVQTCVKMREGHFLRLSKELEACRLRENVAPSVNPSLDPPPSVVGATVLDSQSVNSTFSDSSLTSAQQMALHRTHNVGNFGNFVRSAGSAHSVPSLPPVSHAGSAASSSDCSQPLKNTPTPPVGTPVLDKGPHATVEQLKLAVYRHSTIQWRQVRLTKKSDESDGVSKQSGGRRKEFICKSAKNPRYASCAQCQYRVIFRKKKKPSLMWYYDAEKSNPKHCPMPICCPNQKVTRLELEKDPTFIREVLNHKKMTGKSGAKSALGRDGRLSGSVKEHTARRARNSVMYGADPYYADEFCKLPAWGRQFIADNPGSVFHIEKTADNRYFFFWCGCAQQYTCPRTCPMQVSASFRRNCGLRGGGQTVCHWLLWRGRMLLQAPCLPARISSLVIHEGR